MQRIYNSTLDLGVLCAFAVNLLFFQYTNIILLWLFGISGGLLVWFRLVRVSFYMGIFHIGLRSRFHLNFVQS